jgi:hypothetical protein
MCCNPNSFYVSYFNFLYNCFLKFIIHKINSKMIKSRMVMLTREEKAAVSDANVYVGWMLRVGVGYYWSAGGREGERKLMCCCR